MSKKVEDENNPFNDDIPSFLLRNGKDVTPKYVGRLSEPIKAGLGAPQEPKKPLQAVIVLPDASKAPRAPQDPPEMMKPGTVMDRFRRDGFEEEVYRTTQWDYERKESVIMVQYRRWDSERGLWFIFEKELDKKASVWSGREVYFEGWASFEGKDLLNLGFSELMDLCPYDKGSINSSEWWEGWWSSAQSFWRNETKESQQQAIQECLGC